MENIPSIHSGHIAVVYQPVQRTIFCQQKRFYQRLNIQKPKPYFFYKAQVMKFVQPFYPHPNENKEYKDVCTRPQVVKKVREPSPYEEIIGREVFAWFDNAKLVAILHENPMMQNDKFDLRVLLSKHGMDLKTYSRQLLVIALKNTIYEPILDIAAPQNMYIFGDNTDVTAMRKCVRQFPQIVLMAGVLEKKLLNLNDFVKYGSTDLITAQSQLVQTLRSAGGSNLKGQLMHHPSTLVSRLEQIGTNEPPCDVTS